MAVVKFFYGKKIPAGTVYFLKPNGKTVDHLSTCKKTASGYDTPCVDGARGDRRLVGQRQPLRPVHRLLHGERSGHGPKMSEVVDPQ